MPITRKRGTPDEGFFARGGHPNYLYSGNLGADFDAILALADIGFETYHSYPENFQIPIPIDFGDSWICDHVKSGTEANKPVLLEEYGIAIEIPAQPDQYRVANSDDRNGNYADWLKTVHDSGGAGDLLWMMRCHQADVAADCDAYTVYSAADIPFLAAHATAMRNRTGVSAD